MAIKPINHYSLTANPSVYDEEAMTALELASRTAGKMNETVRAFNELEESTGERLDAQDQRIPVEIAAKVDEHIEGGQFDDQISRYAGNVSARVDNLVAQTPNAPTTMDAEVIDVRVAPTNDTYANAGEAVRESLKTALNAHQGVVKFTQATINTPDAAVIPSSTRVVSSLLAADNVIMIAPSAGYKIKVFWYNEKLEMVANEGFATTTPVYGSEHAFPYLRFILAKENDGEITVSGLNGSEYRLITEKELTKNGYVKITNLPAGQGTINSSGVVEHRTNRVYSPMMKADFAVIQPEKDFLIMTFYYDAEFKLISKMDDFGYNPIFADAIPESAVYVRIATRMLGSGDLSHVDGCHFTIYTKDADVLKRCEAQPPAFVHEMMNIAYSDIGINKINTAPHYRTAAHLGFNAIKGDVEITSDNELIMCHDAGVTLRNGYIVAFDKNDFTPFSAISIDEATALEFKDTFEGNNYKLCTFEEYLQICVESGKIAYITLRDTKIPELVQGVFKALKKYGMIDRCVINSYTYETLQTVRAYSSTVPVSQVLQYKQPITMNDVERVLALGNSIATLFYYPDDGIYQSTDCWDNSYAVLEYARQRGLILHNAQVRCYRSYKICLENGIKGMHLTNSFLPYHTVKTSIEIGIFDGIVDEVISPSAYPISAKVTRDGDVFKISRLRMENGNGVDDGLQMCWFSRMAHTVSVTSLENPDAKIEVVGDEIILHADMDGYYLITIEV